MCLPDITVLACMFATFVCQIMAHPHLVAAKVANAKLPKCCCTSSELLRSLLCPIWLFNGMAVLHLMGGSIPPAPPQLRGAPGRTSLRWDRARLQSLCRLRGQRHGAVGEDLCHGEIGERHRGAWIGFLSLLRLPPGLTHRVLLLLCIWIQGVTSSKLGKRTWKLKANANLDSGWKKHFNETP